MAEKIDPPKDGFAVANNSIHWTTSNGGFRFQRKNCARSRNWVRSIVLRNIGARRCGKWKRQFMTIWSDRKSTRLNSSHQIISYAVFCLKKKKKNKIIIK